MKSTGDARVIRTGKVRQRHWPVIAFALLIPALGCGVLRAEANLPTPPAVQLGSAPGKLLSLLMPVIAAIAVGVAAWMRMKSGQRGRELESANRALAQINEQLKQEAQNVVESEQRSQLLFLSNPCPMLILDCHTMAISDANDAAQQLYGYTREEFLRLTALDIRPPEEHERYKSFLQQPNSGYGHRGSWTHRRKDGSNFMVDISAFRFVHTGHVLDLVLVQDVTARVAAETALLRSEAALKSMVDNAPFGVCSVSLRGDCFMECNPALAEMLGGHAREQMLTMKLSSQLYQDSADYARMVELLRRNGRLNAFEATLVSQDGQPVRVRTWGVLKRNQNDEGDLVDLYIENITEHSTLEQQVRQVQKLEAVGRLAGGIAHDFNNILVVIRLSTELMLGKVTLESPLSKPLLQVLSASDRAAALTRQLLAFGRQQVMRTRTINLNGVVSDTLRLLRRTIGEDVELITRLDPQLHNSRLDPDQVAQVIMNLAINSRDAMPEGGTLEIETRNVDLDESYAQDHGPVQRGKYVMLAVSDSGSGIDSAILPRIFDPFFTTKDLGKGTGLGLSIVYGIVKQSGGYVWVYSEPGHGTTFKLYFPITDSPPQCEPLRAEPQGVTGERTVMVVEDDAQIRQNLTECLQQLGCHVIEAANGIEAIELFASHKGKIDLVLTDLVMPRMSGHELWIRLTHLDQKLSFLFMSGYTEDSAIRREILSQQNAFLNKPFSVADLSSAIHRSLAARGLQNQALG